MFKRALGYDYEEAKTIVEQLFDGSKKSKVERIKKHVPSDVTAQIIWLKNRKRNTWMDNPHRVDNAAELLALRERELKLKEF